MGRIQYDTQDVMRTAGEIDRCNDRVQTDFNNCYAEVKKLSSSWNSSVSDRVIGKFKVLHDQLEVPRYSTMKNEANLLRQVVKVGYDSTESVNEQNARNMI